MERGMTQLRRYRTALAISLVLNAMLVAAFWAYVHFEGLVSIVDTAIGVVN